MSDQPETRTRIEERVEEMRQELRLNNALLQEFGPSVKAFVDAMRDGKVNRKRTLVDYLGEGLTGGKFDGLIEDLRSVVRPVLDDVVRNPPRRVKRRRQR